MRQKRAKAYKRVMALYVSAFGFRTPYQVLISDEFLVEAYKQKDVDILKMVGTTVQGEVKPMITQCCMEALYALGREFQPVVDIAKRCERRKCNHREKKESHDCIRDVVGATNKHRYVLALSSLPFQTSMSTIPGLPIMHFNARGVLVLSPPSAASVRAKNALENERMMEGAKLLEGVKDGGNVVVAGAGAGVEGRKRKPKAPNPLSVRKKKEDKGEGKGEKGGEGKEEKDGKKRKVEEDDDGSDEEVKEGDAGRRKKKRRRGRGKGAVAAAIAELRDGPAPTSAAESGDESP